MKARVLYAVSGWPRGGLQGTDYLVIVFHFTSDSQSLGVCELRRFGDYVLSRSKSTNLVVAFYGCSRSTGSEGLL